MEQETKVRENRVRRIAERRGFKLAKSRLRDPYAVGYGGYMLIDARRNFAVLGGQHFDFSASLEDVEEYLTKQEHQ